MEVARISSLTLQSKLPRSIEGTPLRFLQLIALPSMRSSTPHQSLQIGFLDASVFKVSNCFCCVLNRLDEFMRARAGMETAYQTVKITSMVLDQNTGKVRARRGYRTNCLHKFSRVISAQLDFSFEKGMEQCSRTEIRREGVEKTK